MACNAAAAPWLPRRATAALLAAAAAAAIGPAGAQAPSGPAAGAELYELDVREAALGTARLRGREVGVRLWSAESAYARFSFRIGADYAYTRYEYERLPTRDRDLHHLHLPLSWRDRDDRWQLVLTPVVASSSNVFKDLVKRGGRDDVDLHGRWQLQRPPDAASRGWRVALVRDAAFGAPRLYPSAALLWRDGRVSAELGLPASRVRWQARDDLLLDASLAPAGGSWHVISDERGGAEFDYRARAWRGGVGAVWTPWRRLRVGGHAGIEFARRHRFEDDTGARIDRSAGSAAYVRLSIGAAF